MTVSKSFNYNQFPNIRNTLLVLLGPCQAFKLAMLATVPWTQADMQRLVMDVHRVRVSMRF